MLDALLELTDEARSTADLAGDGLRDFQRRVEGLDRLAAVAAKTLGSSWVTVQTTCCPSCINARSTPAVLRVIAYW